MLGTVAGDTFTLFHVYSKPNGKTVVEEVTATLSSPNVIDRVLFGGPAKSIKLMWIPGEFDTPGDAPNSHPPAPGFTLILQGELIVTVSDGKEYRIKPGNVVIAEDLDGDGHRTRCVTTNKTMGFVQVQVFPEDPETFFENVKKVKIAWPKNAPVP